MENQALKNMSPEPTEPAATANLSQTTNSYATPTNNEESSRKIAGRASNGAKVLASGYTKGELIFWFQTKYFKCIKYLDRAVSHPHQLLFNAFQLQQLPKNSFIFPNKLLGYNVFNNQIHRLSQMKNY